MGNKILIIEDDPLVSRMYTKALGFEKLDVETASNGKDGVEKAKKLQPSLILCDVMMPKMNGMEVLEHLKADPATANIPGASVPAVQVSLHPYAQTAARPEHLKG